MVSVSQQGKGAQWTRNEVFLTHVPDRRIGAGRLTTLGILVSYLVAVIIVKAAPGSASTGRSSYRKRYEPAHMPCQPLCDCGNWHLAERLK
jgi:hypothetical protein